MAEETNTPPPTNPQAGSAGDPPQPQAGILPEPQAGEGSETMSLEEARKLRKEAQALRARLKPFEEAEKQQLEAKRAAEEAELGEKERLTKQFQELQAKYESEVKLRQEITARHDVQRAAEKLNFVYPDLAYSYLKESDFTHDDNGNITNAEELLKDLLKSRPRLAREEQSAPSEQARTPPSTPPMNPSGRAAFPSPTQTPQGNKFVPPDWGQAFQSGPKRS